MKGPVGFGRATSIVMNLILGVSISIVMLAAISAPVTIDAVIGSWFASFCIGFTLGGAGANRVSGACNLRRAEDSQPLRLLCCEFYCPGLLLRHGDFARNGDCEHPWSIGLEWGSGLLRAILATYRGKRHRAYARVLVARSGNSQICQRFRPRDCGRSGIAAASAKSRDEPRAILRLISFS